MTPSNNLKEQVAQAIFVYVTKSIPTIEPEELANLTLDLILDTILASPEMQDETPGNASETGGIHYNAVGRNGLRADLRTMLEGLKS